MLTEQDKLIVRLGAYIAALEHANNTLNEEVASLQNALDLCEMQPKGKTKAK